MEREIKELGLTREELIAALVEDSIGYLVPRSAELHIESWERGNDTCFCERCQWVFEGGLEKCYNRLVGGNIKRPARLRRQSRPFAEGEESKPCLARVFPGQLG